MDKRKIRQVMTIYAVGAVFGLMMGNSINAPNLLRFVGNFGAGVFVGLGVCLYYGAKYMDLW